MTREQICFWRRLDTPGTDVCRLFRRGDGWLLQGTAVFHDQGHACALNYEAEADGAWRALGARVLGHCGGREVALDLRCLSPDRWRLNGEDVELAAPCLDVDLGFTAATNLLALRRLDLAVGAAGESHAAWLDFPAFSFRHLPQTYRRLDEETYDYASPTADYHDRLKVLPSGVVATYPGLFELVTTSGT